MVGFLPSTFVTPRSHEQRRGCLFLSPDGHTSRDFTPQAKKPTPTWAQVPQRRNYLCPARSQLPLQKCIGWGGEGFVAHPANCACILKIAQGLLLDLLAVSHHHSNMLQAWVWDLGCFQRGLSPAARIAPGLRASVPASPGTV